MALESASFVAQLNASNPLSTDTVSQADDHLRLIKAVLKNTFPNLNSAVTATAAQMNAPVPSGFIGMWSGAIDLIPTGWYLCNGSNGTPDLRDRFIVGAGSSYAVGAIGGAASVTLSESQIPSHNHVITATTDSQGAHTHTITDPGHVHSLTNQPTAVLGGADGALDGSGTVTPNDRNYATVNSGTGYTGISINSAGAHTHTITATAGNTGGGGSHENRPPYYALAYIMKA